MSDKSDTKVAVTAILIVLIVSALLGLIASLALINSRERNEATSELAAQCVKSGGIWMEDLRMCIWSKKTAEEVQSGLAATQE